MGFDWVLGWVVDGLAKYFGKASVAGWMTNLAFLDLVVTGVLFAFGLAP
jgi:hypothetical protein